jgi:hypothetical protein
MRGYPVREEMETGRLGNVTGPEGSVTRPAGRIDRPEGVRSDDREPIARQPFPQAMQTGRQAADGASSCAWSAAIRERPIDTSFQQPSAVSGAALDGGRGPCCAWHSADGSLHEGVPNMSAFVRRVLAKAALILGMTVTAAWISLLGYGLIALVVPL